MERSTEVVVEHPRPDRVTVRAPATDRAATPTIEALHRQGRWVAHGPAPDTPPAVTDQLLGELRARCHRVAAGPLQWWQTSISPATDAVAARHDLVLDRQLLQLRRPLPAAAPTIVTRAYRPGLDEAAVLAVNNAAFDWHEEQGGWDLGRLAAVTAEAWFDPEGLRLVERQGSVVGFCWTKVHATTDPPLGEIFVIGVHPETRGEGLGRQLTLAGLDHLHRRGLTTGMLYVEHDNEPALTLYRSLGFTEHHRDGRYTEAGANPPGLNR